MTCMELTLNSERSLGVNSRDTVVRLTPVPSGVTQLCVFDDERGITTSVRHRVLLTGLQLAVISVPGERRFGAAGSDLTLQCR